MVNNMKKKYFYIIIVIFILLALAIYCFANRNVVYTSEIKELKNEIETNFTEVDKISFHKMHTSLYGELKLNSQLDADKLEGLVKICQKHINTELMQDLGDKYSNGYMLTSLILNCSTETEESYKISSRYMATTFPDSQVDDFKTYHIEIRRGKTFENIIIK